MLRKLLAGVGLLLSTASLAHAAYPDRSIQVIVPFTVGGNVDIVARVINQKLEQELGQPVVTLNVAGASGVIGTGQAAKAKPDGYTLLANSSVHVIAPSMVANLRYDPIGDFIPISQITKVPLVLLVSSQLPVTSLKEFIEWGKSSADGVHYATYLGSAGHLNGELVKEHAGVDMKVVPYKSGSAMTSDLMGNHVSVMFDALLSASSMLKTGKVRALAVTSAERSPFLPDVPTFAELGYPDINAGTWHGYWAPKGTPQDIVDRLAVSLAKAARSPDVVEHIKAMGGDAVGSTPAEYAAFTRHEHDRWKALLERAGVKPQ